MTVKTSISLTDRQDAFARGLVLSGQYSSLSAVIQRSLDLLREDTEAREDARNAHLRAAYDKMVQPLTSADKIPAETKTV